MHPSSRTPEGEHNKCHVCGHELRIDPSKPPGDATCPHCGVLLWFADGTINPRESDSFAARAVWGLFIPDLVRLAREKFRGAPRRMADEEDAAASVMMMSLFRAAQMGRFPNLADRHDLWRLLLRMTARKVVIGDVPAPEFAAMMAEECKNLLERLHDSDLAALAVAKMECYTNQEISDRYGCSVRSVERRLRLIRREWQQEPSP